MGTQQLDINITCTQDLTRTKHSGSHGADLSGEHTPCQPQLMCELEARAAEAASKVWVSQQAALPFPASKAGSETTLYTTQRACILRLSCLICLLWVQHRCPE